MDGAGGGTLVVDADAIIALFNPEDSNHSKARALFESFYEKKTRLIYPATALVETRDGQDATDLYHKLSATILPLFYSDREGWTEVMRHTIAHNAAFFNAQRMVQEYASRAYRLR